MKRSIVNKYRKNQDLNPSEREAFESMTDNQQKEISKESEMTPMQAAFSHLEDPTLEKSIEIWSKATDEERDQLRDIYEKRINNYFKNKNLTTEEEYRLNEMIDQAEERPVSAISDSACAI